MTAPKNDPIQRALNLFEARVEALDGPTATALRARRREALAGDASRRRDAPGWLPASGIATATLAVVLWLPRPEGPAPAPPAPAASEAEAARFADAALMELEDDAEFYAWLATVPDDAARPEDATSLPDTLPNEGFTP